MNLRSAVLALQLGAAALLGVGCAGSPQRSTLPTTAVEMDALRITARTGEDGRMVLTAYDAQDLYEQGTALFQDQQCEEAVVYYDRLHGEFPESAWLGPALFNAGLCMQALARFDEAALRYSALRQQRPDSPDFVYATLRLAEVQIQLKDYAAAQTVAEELLARDDLDAYGRLEALARKSQALLGKGELDAAEAHAKSALFFFRSQAEDQALADEFFAAANNFVIAEAYRRRAQAIPFPDDLAGQQEALIQRAEWVLKAQQEYSKTISFVHLDNYHWMTASGYHLGQMYDELWHAVMGAPVPDHLDPEGTDIYHQELAKLIKPLMRHAIRYWEMTLMLVERTGIHNEWSEKTRADLERVRALLLQQPPGPGGLPNVGSPAGGEDGAAGATPPTSSGGAAPASTRTSTSS